MEKVNTTARLAKLRELMKERNVEIYIVPSEDNHASEYIADSDARRPYISGFTGSAGVAIITPDTAVLSTDGRYIIQATKQLDDNWTLLNSALPEAPTWQDWSAEHSSGGKNVGVDASLIASSMAKKLQEKIHKRGGADLVPLEENLVDLVWGTDQPPRPQEPIIVLPDDLAGKTVQAKLHDLRLELGKRQAIGFVISMLDEIAWLLNMRGSDIPYNPVFFSFAIVTPDSTTLYIDDAKLDHTCKKHLTENEIHLRPYSAILDDARRLSATAAQAQQPIGDKGTGSPHRLLLSNKGSWALHRALGGDDMVDEVRSPVGDAKAIKNPTELQGMRACHIRDGAALIEYFAWLEDQLVAKKATLDEVEADDKLIELRSKHDNFVGLSFPTISSTGPNAAIIHYKPVRGNCSVIDPDKIYLCDSGAQFRDGTTGYALDSLARQYLWQYGLDYRHGTGHGVGSYLNVHEGPIGVGTRAQHAEVALSAGNVISNEPGFYVENEFGIRIENIVMVMETNTKYCFGDKPFLGFEHVTMVPYCQNLIDSSLLTEGEIKWINTYNAEIMDKTKGFFTNDPLTMAWLTRETQPI
ncbi:Xaa-Pro aminopeptidase P-like protein [Emericellopsis cladophorae]|uniref:Probable Xaa-Pro aminopeptidase P n=1 Tax=Emericellopsis cladophorae TaxID=2686198 RepID=A0A9P9XV94_9HYPO|nr:Xaa-Pro aminopeptidase P-like protein [Emericellopsis cladophorae]KAI6778248.1 Xaa-Pro aminopeptidase P-like protein [Emericellopsis cladophorae]